MAGADVPAGFLYPQSRKGPRFTVSIDNALCHYRGDQELPSFAERNLSFPDEKKNKESEDPHDLGRSNRVFRSTYGISF